MKTPVKDLFIGILSTITVILLALLVAIVDSLPIWMLLVLAVIFWVILIVLLVRENMKTRTLYVFDVGKGVWVPIDPMTQQEIIKQEEEKRERSQQGW